MPNPVSLNEEIKKYISIFSKKEALSQIQEEQFTRYLQLLMVRSAQMNLTAITDPQKIIIYHFQDSLVIDQFFNFNDTIMIADVGTGAGFPALPLKIKYPHLRVILIEVIRKKVQFLHEVINYLGLNDVEIYQLDWRTFLRKTEYPIHVFLSRASLPVKELIRLFSPVSPYRDSTLIYWASKDWKPAEKEAPFVQKEIPYQVGTKMRKFIFLKKEHSRD